MTRAKRANDAPKAALPPRPRSCYNPGTMARTVLGTNLIACCTEPMTGFFRNGKCDTSADDVGRHTVCAEMTADFLEFSKAMGNDLTTPHPEAMFPGLKPGDRWCLCLGRWIEALQRNKAPRIVLEATHASVLEFVTMKVLREYAVEND